MMIKADGHRTVPVSATMYERRRGDGQVIIDGRRRRRQRLERASAIAMGVPRTRRISWWATLRASARVAGGDGSELDPLPV